MADMLTVSTETALVDCAGCAAGCLREVANQVCVLWQVSMCYDILGPRMFMRFAIAVCLSGTLYLLAFTLPTMLGNSAV